MKITIAANIYPPEIGGPSEYSRQLYETLLVQNHEAHVVTYGELKRYPTGLRHILYFFHLCVDASDTDYVIAMDTFSVGLPAVLFAKLLSKKVVIRIGGDFLWEAWSDRTKHAVLLSEFYTARRKFTLKEKIIFRLTGWILRSAHGLVFSTAWQRDIMIKPYRLKENKTHIVENFYAPSAGSPASMFQPESFSEKIFLSPSRDRFIKNKALLAAAFSDVAARHKDIVLDTDIVSREVLREKVNKSYAVVAASVSEVSPNLVLDALAAGVPAIVTQDTGITDRIHGMVVFVDPRRTEDIARGIEQILDPAVYASCREAIMSSTYTHSWNEIVQEFIDILRK